MTSEVTKLADMVDPEVMADMIRATLPKKIKFSPFAKIDTTLVGQPGDKITVPKWAYIGDAEDAAEGVALETTKLTSSTTQITIKEAGKAVEITDNAILSGYGDPIGEATNQLSMSIASKVDNDCLAALKSATLKYESATAVIGYNGIVEANDLFEDENDVAVSKVMFVNPAQITTLRKDPNFLDINKYPVSNGVIMSGTIGSIAGCLIVPSKKIVKDAEAGTFINPILVTDTRDPKEDPAADANDNSAPGLTIYLKRNLLMESDRDILTRTNVIAATEHYGVALSNASKVVVATFKA